MAATLTAILVRFCEVATNVYSVKVTVVTILHLCRKELLTVRFCRFIQQREPLTYSFPAQFLVLSFWADSRIVSCRIVSLY